MGRRSAGATGDLDLPHHRDLRQRTEPAQAPQPTHAVVHGQKRVRITVKNQQRYAQPPRDLHELLVDSKCHLPREELSMRLCPLVIAQRGNAPACQPQARSRIHLVAPHVPSRSGRVSSPWTAVTAGNGPRPRGTVIVPPTTHGAHRPSQSARCPPKLQQASGKAPLYAHPVRTAFQLKTHGPSTLLGEGI